MNKIRKTSWNTSAGAAQTLDSIGLHDCHNFESRNHENQGNHENHGSDNLTELGYE